jgi:hypothetical protein
MSYQEIHEEIRRHALEVLKCGPVPTDTLRNWRGAIPTLVVPILIHDGDAEEYEEKGKYYIRVKEGGK